MNSLTSINNNICQKDPRGHVIAYAQPENPYGKHPDDKDLICINCGKVLEKYRWNGKYLEIKEV